MRLRLILPWLSLGIGLAAFGCGGGSSSSGGAGASAAGKGVAAFEGSYVGPYTESGADTGTGEVALNISSAGVITGRVVSVTNKTTNSLGGQVTFVSNTATSDTGSFSFVASGSTDGGSVGNLTLNVITGTLTGSITGKTNGDTITFTPGLVSTAGKNSFAGFYNGTTILNGAAGTPANTISMIIDGNGNITALLVDNVPAQSGSGGIGLGTVASSTGAATVAQSSGTLTLKDGVLSGTLTGGTTAQNQPLTLVVTLDANT